MLIYEDSMGEEYSIHLNIQKVENGQFLATSDSLPGLVAQGRTIAETASDACTGLGFSIYSGKMD